MEWKLSDTLEQDFWIGDVKSIDRLRLSSRHVIKFLKEEEKNDIFIHKSASTAAGGRGESGLTDRVKFFSFLAQNCCCYIHSCSVGEKKK